MAKTMRAVEITNGKGPVSALHIAEVPYPEAKPGDAIVKIKAFGLNRMDIHQREGQYPVPPGASKILGVEFSGVVESVHSEGGEGDGVGGYKVGDEVFGLAYGGAYAEYIAISTKMLIHKPKELSWEVATSIPETWITATQALHYIAHFTAGKSILWHAGASSVSLAGIQLSRLAGASAIYVTASSAEKIAFCKSLGATAGFNYKSSSWSSQLLSATEGRGADVIVDFVGGSYFQQNLDAVAKDGIIVGLGFLGGNRTPEAVDIGAFLRKRCRFEGSSLRSRDVGYQGRLRDLLVETALEGIIRGELKVPVERVFSWRDVREAHEVMAGNGTMGKLVCVVD